MAILIYVFVLVSNFIFLNKKRESKFVILLSFFTIVLLISGAGPNYNFWADYDNYELSYNQSIYIGLFDKTEFGYTLLSKIGNFIGLDFFTFRIIITSLCLLLVYKRVIVKYSYNSHYIIFIYTLYQMIVDSEHFRNFIALSILIIAINYLIDTSIKNNLKFIMLIILAGSIHTSFFLYIILLVINSKIIKINVGSLVMLSILLSALIIANNNNFPFINLISNLITDQRIISYLSTSTNFGYLLLFILQISNIALLFISKKIFNIRNNELNNNEYLKNSFNKSKKFVDVVYWINILAIIYFPLFILEINMYRIIRNLLVLNYLVYSITSYRLKRNGSTQILFNSLVLLTVFMWFYVDLTILINPERVLIPFFRENIF